MPLTVGYADAMQSQIRVENVMQDGVTEEALKNMMTAPALSAWVSSRLLSGPLHVARRPVL
eukprot:353360-Chlamydomonas_euryale.AAC.2